MIADDLLEAVDEFTPPAEIDAVREPDDFDVRRLREETADQRQRLAAVDAIGLRLQLSRLHAGGARHLQ